MPIVNSKDILKDARKNGIILPAFNFWTYQDALALITAADIVNAPLILQASSTCIEYNGLELTWKIIETVAQKFDVPVVAHLDHASDITLIEKALTLGFSSIMFEGSLLPVNKNISLSQIARHLTHTYDASLEVELGHVKKGDDDQSTVTDPETAARFIEKTETDSLAVAVGTCHGMQTQKADINFGLVDQLSEHISIPLVLHGSSGVSDEDLKKLKSTGICKINIATRLRKIFIHEAGKLGLKFDHPDHIEYLTRCYGPVIEDVKYLYKLLSSE